MGAVTIYYF
jgi:hypothetical protein